MFPTTDDIKQVARLAANEIECTTKIIFPQRFATIDAAKEHVKEAVGKHDYTKRSSFVHHSESTVNQIKDRAAFLVAIHAFHNGEFYLDQGMPDRQRLRDAIEHDIERARPLVTAWPPHFDNADDAAQYVKRVLKSQRSFTFSRFNGVEQFKFEAYVCWNLARKAWEEWKFSLERLPKGWERKKKVEKAVVTTMTDAIERDLARLRRSNILYPPSFPHLNEARNFISSWCWEHRFQYTSWGDVEKRKYKLFVHWAMAKEGLKTGLFKVDGNVPERRFEVRGGIEKEEEKEKFREKFRDVVKNAEAKEAADLKEAATQTSIARPTIIYNEKFKLRVRVSETEVPAEDATIQTGTAQLTSDGPETINLIDIDSESEEDANSKDIRCVGSSSSSSPGSASPSSPQTSNSDDTLAVAEKLAELQLEQQNKALTDPFKNLLAELERGQVLKAAFG